MTPVYARTMQIEISVDEIAVLLVLVTRRQIDLRGLEPLDLLGQETPLQLARINRTLSAALDNYTDACRCEEDAGLEPDT